MIVLSTIVNVKNQSISHVLFHTENVHSAYVKIIIQAINSSKKSRSIDIHTLHAYSDKIFNCNLLFNPIGLSGDKISENSIMVEGLHF